MNCQARKDEHDSGGVSSVPLPPALQQHRFADYLDAFFAEYQPVGITEVTIAKDIARRAARMELMEDIIGALQRESARALMAVRVPLSSDDSSRADAVLASSVASDWLDRCDQHSLGSTRAFIRSVKYLRELQSERRTAGDTDNVAVADTAGRFATDADCADYLEQRLRQADGPCRSCGNSGGSWLTSRRCWECRACGFQQGLRIGTVMQRSSLPLTTWFAAIGALLRQPTISTTDLAQCIGIRRLATVRSMADRIRQGIASGDPSGHLAGLDQIFEQGA